MKKILRLSMLPVLGVFMLDVAAADTLPDVAAVRLQAYNGQFVCAEGSGGGTVVANRNWGSTWETFTIEPLDGWLYDGARVALRANNGQYFCAEGGGGGSVVANRNIVGPWETFRLEVVGGGSPFAGRQVALRAYNGQYLCAEGGGGRELVANRWARGTWETFYVNFLDSYGAFYGRPSRTIDVQALAEQWAPIVYHTNDESNYPTNVDWFLPKTALRGYDDGCWPDWHYTFVNAPSQYDLLGWWFSGGCGSSDTVYSNGTRSNQKQRTFYLSDVADGYRAGSWDSRDWRTYYHAYPNHLGGLTIQYWRFYAYNDAANNHGGDWEGVQVVLNAGFGFEKARFLGHSGIEEHGWGDIQWEGTHMRVYSEGGGHASRTDGSGIYANTWPWYVDPNLPWTHVRQETWTGGAVTWTDGALTTSGGLLEFGPKIAPKNGQVFVQYSGIWGSPGTFYFTSGYWGPAFNETAMGSDGFVTAWCHGISTDPYTMRRECYPAAVSR